MLDKESNPATREELLNATLQWGSMKRRSGTNLERCRILAFIVLALQRMAQCLSLRGGPNVQLSSYSQLG